MKNHRQMIPVGLLVCLVAAPAAFAVDTNPPRNPIRPVSNCMDLSRSHEIYAPSNKTIIAKTGPKYYRIDLTNACGTLNAATLKFKVADDKRTMQRMCGELGDQIVNQDGLHCNVQSVSMINKQQFRKLEAQSKARR